MFHPQCVLRYSPGQFSRLDTEFGIGILQIWIFYFLLLWCEKILFSSLCYRSLWWSPYCYKVCFSDPVPGSLSFPPESRRGELREQAIWKTMASTRNIFKAQFLLANVDFFFFMGNAHLFTFQLKHIVLVLTDQNESWTHQCEWQSSHEAAAPCRLIQALSDTVALACCWVPLWHWDSPLGLTSDATWDSSCVSLVSPACCFLSVPWVIQGHLVHLCFSWGNGGP